MRGLALLLVCFTPLFPFGSGLQISALEKCVGLRTPPI